MRGARAIAEADVVVWAASLVHEDVLEHARSDASIVDSAALPLEGVRALYERAVAEGLVVARVHSGDPALWGAVQEQREICNELGLAHETVPGVSAFSAVAAIVDRELTVPEVAQSVVLTRLEGGKTPMPPGETVRGFAAHGTTMALFLSAARSGQLQAELLAGGYAPDTPCVVAYQATWPDELVLHCTVGTLEATCKEHKLWKHTLVLVGPALVAGGTRSHLYHPGHFHGYRRPDRAARRALLAAERTHPPGFDHAIGDDHAIPADHAIPVDHAPGDHFVELTVADVTVIGIDGGSLPAAAVEAVGHASLVIGGTRHLELVGDLVPPAARVITLGPLEPALAALAERTGHAVVLASGDPGWFGIVRTLRERGIGPRVLPAPSSVSQLAARAGIPWDGVATVSAHGRDVRPAINAARALPRVAVLTGPDLTPADLGRALDGWHRDLVVGERLGHDDEHVVRCTAEEAAARGWAEPNVVLVTDPTRPATPVRVHDQPAAAPDGGWALPEGAFEHRDAMVTKAEVRALVVARLAPSLGRLVWDVGAGSGSVGIECARLGAAVVAVERDAAACVQVAANAERHGVGVRVVHGEAPAALSGLPEPDAVFVGGGGPDVVAAVAALEVPAVVAAYASLERVVAARAALVDYGYVVDGAQLLASRLATLPDGAARLAALNPVTVLWARRGDDDPRELQGAPPGRQGWGNPRELHDRPPGGGA